MEQYSGKRYELLKEAMDTVCMNRQDQYGNPENNFDTIANFWSKYLASAGVLSGENNTINLTAHDVAAMMILVKVSRIANGNPKKDNWTDIAGYSACGAELQGV